MVSYVCLQLFIVLSTISVLCSASVSSVENNNEQDKSALLALREGFIGGGAPPDGGALSSWNSSLHFCQWQGVTCGKRHKRVTAIELPNQKLDGVLSPSIGNLTFLRTLFLANNSLHGKIPKETGQLRRLRHLHLGRNSFQGDIPVELSNCSNLLQMSLHYNNLTGQFPFQFGSLLKMTLLHVYQNNLVGELPSFLRNFSSLSDLDLGSNHFYGYIQDSLKGLSSLTILALGSNSFSGSISPLYNLSSLRILDISMNHFTGSLAHDMDVAFPNAVFLSFFQNNFTGEIPSSLSNITGLEIFQIMGNSLTGRVPDNLGKLKNLRVLQLGANLLGSKKSDDLRFINSLTNCTKLSRLIVGYNRFGGLLPVSSANLTSDLQLFHIRENFITGPIPEGIGELRGLTAADLSNNLFSGTIPNSIGKLRNMSTLYLHENHLHGGIPSSIGNLTKLFYLHLYGNYLDGQIPTTLGNCKGMQVIAISRNHLNGTLPADVFSQFQVLLQLLIDHNSFEGQFPNVFGTRKNLNAIDASFNNFSGEIPAQLGESSGLEYLIMGGNSFNGTIPASLGNLRGLRRLDLSNNDLSGAIPKELANLVGLQYLNLSFNRLEGEVPLFKNGSAVSVVGNKGLCGGNPELHLHSCSHQGKGKTSSKKFVIAVTLSVLASFALLVVLIFFLFRSHKQYKEEHEDDLVEGYERVSYTELFKATDGFAESNLIGTGSFGDVYKAILHQNDKKSVALKVLIRLSKHRAADSKPVAVKVLKLSKRGAAKSFTAECKVLRRIRHRNLLAIITSCSSLDYKGNDFKALVFNFMSNGSLDAWLHSTDRHRDTGVLTLAKRMEIAIDVGCALDYLHNDCETPIVHCDLKPSNILLDDDMVAHVSDFGLAKLLLDESGDFSGGESLSTVFKGSIGYVAPEYGMGSAVSPQGDIYSYGILLLELITGRRPADEEFNDEMSLRSFCERALPDHVEEIIDPSLVNELHQVMETGRNPEQIELQYHAFLISFVEVGISCAAESPRDRMLIQSAIQCLERIKEKFDSMLR
uniref:non-specific serine/threonine protein kinase n=1 Tax=Kalanchoe fedtschenkoi TaxID=63787 RepID=A0A7N0TSN6_KALFE